MEKSFVEVVNDYYEKFMFGGNQLVFDKIGFFNLGYWTGIEDSVERGGSGSWDRFLIEISGS